MELNIEEMIMIQDSETKTINMEPTLGICRKGNSMEALEGKIIITEVVDITERKSNHPDLMRDQPIRPKIKVNRRLQVIYQRDLDSLINVRINYFIIHL
jgi:hypothetical protein